MLDLFRSCCLIGKSLKCVEVSCLCYLNKIYSYFELLLLQYLFKNVECLKIIITTLVKQAYTDFLVLQIILINPVFITIIVQKIYKFRRIEFYFSLILF